MIHQCICGSNDVTEEEEVTSCFDYGWPDSIAIQVTEAVMTCHECKSEWTDWRSEEAREKAVKAYREFFRHLEVSSRI